MGKEGEKIWKDLEKKTNMIKIYLYFQIVSNNENIYIKIKFKTVEKFLTTKYLNTVEWLVTENVRNHMQQNDNRLQIDDKW